MFIWRHNDVVIEFLFHFAKIAFEDIAKRLLSLLELSIHLVCFVFSNVSNIEIIAVDEISKKKLYGVLLLS